MTDEEKLQHLSECLVHAAINLNEATDLLRAAEQASAELGKTVFAAAIKTARNDILRTFGENLREVTEVASQLLAKQEPPSVQ